MWPVRDVLLASSADMQRRLVHAAGHGKRVRTSEKPVSPHWRSSPRTKREIDAPSSEVWQLLALLGRQPVALARVHGRLPDPAGAPLSHSGRSPRQIAASDRSPWRIKATTSALNSGVNDRRCRPACPVPLHL